MKQTGNNRIQYLDIARIIALCWIVGWWHLIQYSGPSYKTLYKFLGSENITVLMLALFIFLSGYMIGRKAMSTKEEVLSFYKKRFQRFYILFALAIITFPLTGYNKELSIILTTLTATSTYILPQPVTLWFLSMLASFYIFSPFIKYRKGLGGAIVFLLILVCDLAIPSGIDQRFYMYYPTYCVGLFLSSNQSVERIISSNLTGLILIAITSCLYFVVNSSSALKYIYLATGICSLLFIAKKIENESISRIVNFVAYSSMCAYLFHRHIYTGLSIVLSYLGIEGDIPAWVLVVTFFPICIIISYYIQSSYDLFLRKTKKH